MRIAFVTGRFPVLSEPFILNQVTGTVARGGDVHVFAVQGRPEAGSKIHPDFHRFNLDQKTHYPPQPPNGTDARLQAIEEAIESIRAFRPREAAALTELAQSQQKPPAKLVLRGVELARHGPFDVIHCQFGFFAEQMIRLRDAGVHDAAVLTTFRGGDISRHVKENGPQVYERTFESGDWFFSNCGFFRDKAVAIGCPAERIEIHGSGIDLSKFRFRPRTLPAGGAPVRIATTGRLVEKKGIAYVLDAVAELLRKGRNVRFDVIGDGPLRADLDNQAERLGLVSNVTFHGWRNQTEIIEILDHCHLFVAASVTAENGDQDAPVNTLKEAMAMGMPVVASCHGGIPELVENGVSGFLVRERDPVDIAAGLNALIDRGHRWPDMGAAGRQAVEKQFDMLRLNDTLISTYRRLAADRMACEVRHAG